MKARFPFLPFLPFSPFARSASALLPAVLSLLSSTAAAQTAPAGDHGAVPVSEPAPEKLPAYHHSIFAWEHTVTSQTLGVGDTPQSSNPTYGMGFVDLPEGIRLLGLIDHPASECDTLKVGMEMEVVLGVVDAGNGEQAHCYKFRPLGGKGGQ